VLALVNAEAEDVNLKNCALGGSIILSTGGSTFVSAEALFDQKMGGGAEIPSSA